MSKFKFQEKINQLKSEVLLDISKEIAERTKDQFVKNVQDQGLVKTGQLVQDVNDSIRDVNKDGFRIEVNNDYAIYLQEGTDRMAAKPFIVQDEELTEMQRKIIKERLDRLFK